MRFPAPLLGLAAVSGCGVEEASEGGNVAAAAPPAVELPKRLDIFIARTEVPETKSSGGGTVAPLALFQGRYTVADGCLLFEGAGETYLPVFPAAAEIHVTEEAVHLGGRPIPLGAPVNGGGGSLRYSRTYLAAEPPAGCRLPLLRLWSVAELVTPPGRPDPAPAPLPPERQPPSPAGG
jgi:hypothetical protein